MYARSFKDLRVYQKAREVSRAVFRLSKHWVREALDCGYLPPAEGTQLISDLEEVGRMLHSMMAKAVSFCGPPDSALHESAPDFFTDD